MYFVYTRAFVGEFDIESFEESCTGRGFLLDKFKEVDGLILEEVIWKEEKRRSYNDTAGLLDIPLEHIDIDLGQKAPYVAIGHAFIGGHDFLAKASEIAKSISNQLAEVPNHLFGEIYFQQLGGAMRDVPPDATAFWNRSQTDFSTEEKKGGKTITRHWTWSWRLTLPAGVCASDPDHPCSHA